MTQEAAIKEAEETATATPFDLGRILLTAGVANSFDSMSMIEGSIFHDFLSESLTRHTDGDWGDVDEEDWETNNDSVETGGRILSAYETKKYPQLDEDLKIWIITEADRSATTILFPYEY